MHVVPLTFLTLFFLFNAETERKLWVLLLLCDDFTLGIARKTVNIYSVTLKEQVQKIKTWLWVPNGFLSFQFAFKRKNCKWVSEIIGGKTLVVLLRWHVTGQLDQEQEGIGFLCVDLPLCWVTIQSIQKDTQHRGILKWAKCRSKFCFSYGCSDLKPMPTPPTSFSALLCETFLNSWFHIPFLTVICFGTPGKDWHRYSLPPSLRVVCSRLG